LHRLIIVGVINDDYLAITRRPEDVTVELTKKFFLANSSSREVSTTSEEMSLTGVTLEALPCSNT
jgi:hypothetical protein